MWIYLLTSLLIAIYQSTDIRDLQVPMNEAYVATPSSYPIVEEHIPEASGIDVSYNFPGHLWVHNDSGDRSFLYLLDSTGTLKTKVYVRGAQAQDWEDITTTSVDGKGVIFIGDIGDNRGQRDYLTIYRVEEPDNIATESVQASKVTRMDFTYSEGARDSETLMYDQSSNELVLVTKRENECLVYHFPFRETRGIPVKIQSTGSIPFNGFTGGDIRDDGTIILKNYNSVFIWESSDQASWSRLLEGPSFRMQYVKEPQGEAICWTTTGIVTLSEAAGDGTQSLYKYELK